MRKIDFFIKGMLVALVPLLLASECCYQTSCEEACAKLVECEAKWLADEHKSAMSDVKREDYYEACYSDCQARHDFESCCIEQSSCEQIRQGDCSR